MVLKNRKLRFEIFGLMDDHWVIDQIVDDDEELAVSVARELLNSASGPYSEIRVVRQRSMRDFTQEREVMHEVRPPGGPPPIVLQPLLQQPGVCVRPGDLFGLESRMVIGRLLGRFLSHHQALVGELLHNWHFIKKLDESGRLAQSAIYAVAKYQAASLGVPINSRIEIIEDLVDEVSDRVRDVVYDLRKLRDVTPETLDRTVDQLRQRVGPLEGDFVVGAALAKSMHGMRSISQKMEYLVALVSDETDPATVSILERMMSDGLQNGAVLGDLYGPQENLAGFVTMVADSLLSRPFGPRARPTPSLLRVTDLMARGKAPDCRAVMTERLIRELNSSKLLDRRDPALEETLVARLGDSLRAANGQILGGQSTLDALENRKRRYRQDLLRRDGLEDVADGVGQSFG